MTGPRRNIELKARCADLAAARAASERCGARFVHVEEQRDTFFQAASGRLKLRERTWRNGHGAVDRSEAELIGYRREDVAGARESRYTVVPVPDARPLLEACSMPADAEVITFTPVPCVPEPSDGEPVPMTIQEYARAVAEAVRDEMIEMYRDLRNPAGINLDAIIASVPPRSARSSRECST